MRFLQRVLYLLASRYKIDFNNVTTSSRMEISDMIAKMMENKNPTLYSNTTIN